MSADKPITDEHIAFAEELVALARKHGATDLTVEFSLTGGRRFFEKQYNPTKVRFQWCEGRHGARSRYTLRAEACVSLDEDHPHV